MENQVISEDLSDEGQQPASTYAAPAVVDLALEFLRGNSASAALTSLLGQTTSLVTAMRNRDRVARVLQKLLAHKGGKDEWIALNSEEQGRKLTTTLLGAGLRLPGGSLSSRIRRDDVREWGAVLLQLQEKDMAGFEQIKQKVDRGAGQLYRFIEISENLLHQLPGLAPLAKAAKT